MNNYIWNSEVERYSKTFYVNGVAFPEVVILGKWIKDKTEENSWNSEMKKQSYEFIQEFKKTDEYKELLLEQIKAYKKYLKEIGEVYLRLVNKLGKDFADAFYESSDAIKIEKKLNRVESDYTLKFESREGKINDEMIEKAKQYPFENLIQVIRNWAICPFHNDKKPSFYVKNNFGHCFVCKITVDTIALVMKRDNLNFIQAVVKLQ